MAAFIFAIVDSPCEWTEAAGESSRHSPADGTFPARISVIP
jgi:hypothetical protein